MHIWVDADACPRAIKEIVFRASVRKAVEVTLVANQWMPRPSSALIRIIQVEQGPDIADDMICDLCAAGDLVITADIPLAARIVAKGAYGLNPRGEFYDGRNVGQKLAMRDFMDNLRGSGIETGGPAALSAQDREKFANRLDAFLARPPA